MTYWDSLLIFNCIAWVKLRPHFTRILVNMTQDQANNKLFQALSKNPHRKVKQAIEHEAS